MTLFAIALIVVGVAIFGGLLGILLLAKKSHDAGALEERNAETNRSDAAKARADEVLAESRNPDDAVDRLRRGDF